MPKMFGVALIHQIAKFAILGNCFAITSTSLHATEIQFQEVTNPAGISYAGTTFGGGSWGDVNGDGWPDVWIAGHFSESTESQPTLYVNNKDGTFSNESNRIGYKVTDTHGSAWADFDNDGDQDLLMLVGAVGGTGSLPNQFFINNGGSLTDRAIEYNLDYPLARGRTPLWFDWNGDGTLDVFLSNTHRNDGLAPSRLFTRMDGVFVDSFSATGLTSDNTNLFSQLITVGQNNVPSLLITGSPAQELYSYQSIPFEDLSRLGFMTRHGGALHDTAIADFNGDLLPDVFLVQRKDASEAIQADTNSISASLIVRDSEYSFTFRSTGILRFQIEPNYEVTPSDIHIGSSGDNPAARVFSISSTDTDVAGILPYTPGTDFGVFIGYDQPSELWQVSARGSLRVAIVLTAEEPITEFQTTGFTNQDGELADRLLLQNNDSFIDKSSVSGIVTPTACESVTAADFDNDMDVDIYLVCQAPASNRPNILLENLGSGRFQMVSDAGGAAGSSLGLGDGVSSVDYDGDGYVDLFVTNGRGLPALGNGPAQLFRNSGGTNHWIEIDLEGVSSNRDGIGARVVVTADGVNQIRYRDGGMHRFTQNHKRLHFGLGTAELIDKIEIEWPSGILQVLRNVTADRVINIPERNNDNDAPTIGGRPAVEVEQGETYSFVPAAADSDGDTLLFSVKNKPSWMKFDPNTGALTGTPGITNVGSDNNIVIAVDDQRGLPNSVARLESFNLTVNNIVNDAPELNSPIGLQSVASGTFFGPLDISGHFSDADGEKLTFSLSGLPLGSGISISAAGIISGFLTDNDAAASPISLIVTATDPHQASSSDTLTLLISAADIGPVDLSGTVTDAGGTPLCSLVLASGQLMFSCNPNGPFFLNDLPRETDGSVKRQVYVDGFFPNVETLAGSRDETVVMTRANKCPDYNAFPDPGTFPESAGKRIDVSGKVLLQNTQTPVCGMVLGNGQFVFACDGSGSYAANIPLDANGQYKLQVYAEGFAPMVQAFDEFNPNVEVRLARAAECQ